MSKLNENNIIDSLQNFSEIPSERCWESIAQNLPPVNPISGNTPADPSSSNAITQFFSSVAGKITAIATTAIVATTIGITYFDNTENEASNEASIETTAQTELNDTIKNQKSNSANFEILENSTNKNVVSDKINNKPTEKNNIIDKPETNTEKNNKGLDKTANPQISQPENEKPKEIKQTTNEKLQTAHSAKNTTRKSETTHQTQLNNENTDNAIEIVGKEEEINKNEQAIISSNKIQKLDVSNIIVPNVFTPNNDGYNDYLVFQNLDKYAQNRLIVVNSKGNIVFERYQYDNSWDAPSVPDGSYFFILEISDSGLNTTIQGILQILR